MASPSVGRKRKPTGKSKDNPKLLKRKREVDDLENLEKGVDELDIKLEIKTFSDLPLSQATTSGLGASHFKSLTDIQSKAIPLALKGKDILGAAKTGSGKTLAFLVPVLEKLYRARWTEFDGLGALIISPTRELAIQIFEVLRKVGRYHSFSAALVIGGGDLKGQQERLGRMNILVCTPGRMLQHMDQTAAFEVGNLQVLVLDEADRIMDMGFQSSVDAIIEHLPKERQTMLFSATQTKKVSDLARLNLRDPEYVAVHEAAASSTPSTLQQHYVVVPLSNKLNTLFGFIRANLTSKIIVFFSSAKQVRYTYETFRHLQPGIPLLHLHGRQKLSARLDVTSKFSASKNSCIFATDVVARGLDFPAVDWVIQLDCPEDADTYIHRVGRTARSEKPGKAVLILDPSEEEGMIKRLEHKKVPIQKINIRKSKEKEIGEQLQKMCFQDPELKYLGKKAFESYAKSLWLQRDKEVFNIDQYDLEGFHASMGLPGAPKIKFRKGDDTKKLKNAPRGLDDDSDEPQKPEVRTKYDRMFERRNQDVLSSHYSKTLADGGTESQGQHVDADEDDDFLSVKRVIPVDELGSSDEDDGSPTDPTTRTVTGIGKNPIIIDSKRREKLFESKKKLLKYKEKGVKMVYDDDGVAHQVYELEGEEDFERQGPAAAQRAKFVEAEAERVREADIDDKQLAKQKKRERKERKKARETADQMLDEEEVPTLVDNENGEDPLALLASLPLPGDDDEEEDRPAKRSKKWFEDGSGDETGQKGRVVEADEEPETLEDLEALAAGLLN